MTIDPNALYALLPAFQRQRDEAVDEVREEHDRDDGHRRPVVLADDEHDEDRQQEEAEGRDRVRHGPPLVGAEEAVDELHGGSWVRGRGGDDPGRAS